MWSFWLLIILVVIFIISLPVYPYSRTWGYYRSGAAGLALLTVLILILFGVIAFTWPAY